jgi:hypothetical protein
VRARSGAPLQREREREREREATRELEVRQLPPWPAGGAREVGGGKSADARHWSDDRDAKGVEWVAVEITEGKRN